ncbi:MAG: hypothetical protein VKJ24_05830 [Synechococcales bacterium]|nr:hypothetical protein [Synechococcales bacterium]
MTVATINGLKTIRAIPKPGQQILSVNLSLVDFIQLSDIAKQLGFRPEVVQVAHRTRTEIHALLWQGEMLEAPADLADKIDQLAGLINPDAIYSVRGRSYADLVQSDSGG